MGPAELHLITKSPLNFCCLLLRRISQPLLNEYSQMQISSSPVTGTLIPSAQRVVWAAKQPLGNAALGALYA